jgi:hypothetical protein
MTDLHGHIWGDDKKLQEDKTYQDIMLKKQGCFIIRKYHKAKILLPILIKYMVFYLLKFILKPQ